jgi:hypothetical protein
MRTSPVPLILISGLLLPQIIACVIYQELLHVVCKGKSSNIFHLHQLLVKIIILVSVVLSIKILDVQRVGRNNAYMRKKTC